MRKLIFIGIFFLISSSLWAQRSKGRSAYNHSRDSRWAAVGVHAGYYRPILFYWNELYFGEDYEARWRGDLKYGMTIDYFLRNNIYLRIGADIWSDKLETGTVVVDGVSRSESISLSAVMGSVVGYYEKRLMPGLFAYGGLGIGTMNAQTKHTITPSATDEQTSDSGTALYGIGVGGAYFMLTEMLDVGIELRLYWPGHYKQSYRDDIDTKTSFAGPSGLIRLAYRLDWNVNRDRLDVRRRAGSSARGR